MAYGYPDSSDEDFYGDDNDGYYLDDEYYGLYRDDSDQYEQEEDEYDYSYESHESADYDEDIDSADSYRNEQVAKPPLKSIYKPEISPAAIRAIIRRIMEEHKVKEQDIPDEGVYIPPHSPKSSKIYFEVKGFAWFTCPKKHWNPKLHCETIKRWPSAHSWCFIDLKTQTICYRDKQQCKKCNSEAQPGPEFMEEVIERMATFAVRGYLIRTGRLKVPQRSTDTNETEGGPHDEERCGKCKRLGRSCWK